MFVMSFSILNNSLLGTYDKSTNCNHTAIMMYTDGCISAHNLNIFTIPSVLESFEYFLIFKFHTAFCKNCQIISEIFRNKHCKSYEHFLVLVSSS